MGCKSVSPTLVESPLIPISSTLNSSDLEQSSWDVVIIGAGLAGASAAIQAAKHGLTTLLVESKAFPREKVCGGCLNSRSQASLGRLGVLPHIVKSGAIRIESMHLQILKTSVHWKVPAMMSVRRSTLDSILVREAIKMGAQYLDKSIGSLMTDETGAGNELGKRFVQIQTHEHSVMVDTKCVLVASGLSRTPLKNRKDWPMVVEENSRIGVQCLLPASAVTAYSDQQLHMLVGSRGYVGICATDGNLFDVAAAVDPSSIQPSGGIANVVNSILDECQSPRFDWPNENEWSATPALTRSSKCVASNRVFLIGDAIGYVEPFTGEGMSWALASAEAVIPFVLKLSELDWKDEMAEQWNRRAYRQRVHNQTTCRWIANRIRHPRPAAWVLRACNWIPPIRNAIIRKTSQ